MRFTQVFFLFFIISAIGTPASADRDSSRDGNSSLSRGDVESAAEHYAAQIKWNRARRDFDPADIFGKNRHDLFSYVRYFEARRGLSEIDTILERHQAARERRVADIKQLSFILQSNKVRADKVRAEAFKGGRRIRITKRIQAKLTTLRSYACLLGDNQLALGNYQEALASYSTAEYYAGNGGWLGWRSSGCFLWGQAYSHYKLENWDGLAKVIKKIASPKEQHRSKEAYRQAIYALDLDGNMGGGPYQARPFEDALFNKKVNSITLPMIKDAPVQGQ